MQQLDYKTILKQSGLSDTAIAVYEVLLRCGTSSASQLARTTGLKRGNTYYILEQLTAARLVETAQVRNTTVFQLSHPAHLQENIRQQQQRLEQAKQHLDVIMPDLLSQYSLASKQAGVFRFSGKDGVLRVYEALLADRLDIDAVQDYDAMEKLIPEYLNEFKARRIAAGLRLRSIQPSQAQRGTETDTASLQSIHYIDAKLYPFTMDFNVTSTKLVMTSLEKTKPVGIVVVDAALAKNFQMLFALLWQLTSA